jgi:hypothetical protein
MIAEDWMHLIGSEGNSERPILTCNEEGHSRAHLGQGIENDCTRIEAL